MKYVLDQEKGDSPTCVIPPLPPLSHEAHIPHLLLWDFHVKTRNCFPSRTRFLLELMIYESGYLLGIVDQVRGAGNVHHLTSFPSMGGRVGTIQGKEHRLGSQPAWAWIPLCGCVSLGKLLTLSGPWLSHM